MQGIKSKKPHEMPKRESFETFTGIKVASIETENRRARVLLEYEGVSTPLGSNPVSTQSLEI
jgi:hypothetical protein